MTSKGKKYTCPYCDYRNYRPELINHVQEEHEEMIPKDHTATRVVYNSINKRTRGTCMVCHKETKWDENKQRYDSLCGSPKCKEEYVKMVRSRMTKKYGTYNLLKDPEFQKKMLENRSISGKYKFQDGGSVGYVGSYEKKFLEFMDVFLHVKSYDIISPGPTIPYMYKGKEHVWITDYLYEPYNLVFDIKDGGSNPNTRDMKEYREKQLAKEKAIAEYGDYNYIRLTDNKFEQLISIFMELKEKSDDKPLIRINESYIQEETSEYMNKLTAFHLEPVIPNKKRPIGGWDEELYYKDMESAIDDIKNNYHVKDETSVKAYVFTAGKDLKAIYLGTIYILDKNKGGWEWDEKESLSDDAYDYLKSNPMESALLSEETRIEADKLPKYVYHISSVNHNGEVFEPRNYDNENVKNGMERYVKRVCFADSITRCLYSIFPNGAYDADFYVHVPAHEVKVYSTTKEDIYDAELTHELWVKEPVEMKCIGKIHISGVSNKKYRVLSIESDKVPYNKKKYYECLWNWVEKYDEDKSLFESCIEEGNVMKYCKYKECPKCGSTDIGVYVQGEPIYKCKECGEYLGTVPFTEEVSIDEGLIWNDNTPEDIKKLKEKIKEVLDVTEAQDDVVDVIKDTLKNRDFTSDEKSGIYKALKKLGMKVHGYSIKTSNTSSVELMNTHGIITTYKNYILSLSIIGVKGKLSLISISINYDADKCDIPKNVAFDVLSMMSPDIDKVSSSKHVLKVSALSKAIETGYPRVSHKYSNKYKVKKNIGGLSITISTYKDSIKEDSAVNAALPRQDYQPDAVYIVNYLKKNTFVNDLAVCKDNMSSIFVCDDGKPMMVSFTEFRNMVKEAKVYKLLLDSSFDHIVKLSKSGLDFYKNAVGDDEVTIDSLDKDYRFNKLDFSYIDEMNSIEECIINSVPKQSVLNEVYCPIIPLVGLNESGSIIHYFRDIDGVFAQNIDTLKRSASYNSVDDIPKSTINTLKFI